MNSSETLVNQIWFPGAHADVGGGYSDDNRAHNEGFYDGLSQISLKWMLDQLMQDLPERNYSGYTFKDKPRSITTNSLARSHFSLGDFPANFGSECLDSPLPVKPMLYATPSHQERLKKGTLPVVMKGKTVVKPYPLECKHVE
jgi:hypothetical protein